MLRHMESYPSWLLILVGVILVAMLGYVDYVTGDYSMLIFYLVPVFWGGWFLGRGGAVVIALAAGLARFLSDFNNYSGSAVRYWNSFQDMGFLLMVGLLIAMVKRLLTESTNTPED